MTTQPPAMCEFEIRRLARLLKHLLVELHQHKTLYTHRARQARPMRPALGPQAPGNLAAISLHYEIERELHYWMRTLTDSKTPKPITDLCDWIAFNAYDIAVHPDAESFQQTLALWVTQAEQLLGRGVSLKHPYRMPEGFQTARSICYRLKQQGYSVTPERLRKWVERGKIHAIQTPDGHNWYLLSEVLGCVGSGVAEG